MQGRDLNKSHRDHAYIQYEAQLELPGLGLRPYVFTIRDARYRLSLFQGLDLGELYDLETDAGKFENLWDDPDHSQVHSGLIKQLARSSFASNDTVPMPVSKA